jgi:hypothetical protein
MQNESDIFFVWNPSGGQWKHKHTTYESAQKESERLARLNPGQKFYVIGALGFAHVEPYPKVFTELEIRVPPPF